MANNFSLNDSQVAIEQEVVEMQGGQVPKVHLDNLDTYKIAVNSMRDELIKLVQEGLIAEAVAEKLLIDFQFNTFNQVIKLRFE